MQLSSNLKTKLAAGLLLLPIAGASYAGTETLSGSFKTIKDVTITQVAGYEMVLNGLLMAQNATCTMTAAATGATYIGDTVLQISTANSNASGADAGKTTAGATCQAVAGQLGVYEIEGSPGAQIIVSVTDTTAGTVAFAPAGCVTNYDDGANGDSCDAVSDGAPATVNLANTGDLVISAGEGLPVVGFGRVVLGGTATANVGLSAATQYDVNFDVSVTY